ncbi:hypothetical protein F2Q68_00033519 [Brassica cretica]|uniref:Uncharacterized protein n=1 Tax=Brassica cretica TaxID=69181 RepID=A0A8S9GYS4_BRACR|nr:hypothetical protein F2Q68_00033519 [Brassica cretica]
MFSEFELPLDFEDCRTGPPREPRAGRDASWNKLERTRAEDELERDASASYRVCELVVMRAGS